MLFITFNTSNGEVEKQWYTGEQKPLPPLFEIRSYELQADGYELEYILDRFDNIPKVRDTRMVTWRGEFAQFIYDHLT